MLVPRRHDREQTAGASTPSRSVVAAFLPAMGGVALMLLCGCAVDFQRVGGACTGDTECVAGATCLTEASFPGGYCVASCARDACGTGQRCVALGGQALCLKECQSRGDCREGYQCWQEACQPVCTIDDHCGLGYRCSDGQCVTRPGASLGQPCAGDAECSSQLCVDRLCTQACGQDGVCGAGQMCGLHEVDGVRLVGVCMARRGGQAPGAACTTDDDCDRGTCQLGICVELCEVPSHCVQNGMTCAGMTAVLMDDETTASFKGCLPDSGMLEFASDDRVLVPSSGVALALHVSVPSFDLTNTVGIIQLTDPAGTELYTPPSNEAEFFKLPVRYTPTEVTSTMLVTNQPMIQLMPGRYTFGIGAQKSFDAAGRVYLKLGAAPWSSGRAALHFYVTDLSGGCQPSLTAANAATVLSSAISEIKSVFGQVNITITDVTFSASTADNVIRVETGLGPSLPDLPTLLAEASAGQAGPAGLQVVLVREIQDGGGGPSNVLGVAGGIPGAPMSGTPHSGSVVSIETLCGLGQTTFGHVIAHEIGHTLGLFHNVEQSGEDDPLTDTAASGSSNLMYWLESSGSIVTPQQGQVMRNDPKVLP